MLLVPSASRTARRPRPPRTQAAAGPAFRSRAASRPRSGRNTRGNSSPLALWTDRMRTASTVSSASGLSPSARSPWNSSSSARSVSSSDRPRRASAQALAASFLRLATRWAPSNDEACSRARGVSARAARTIASGARPRTRARKRSSRPMARCRSGKAARSGGWPPGRSSLPPEATKRAISVSGTAPSGPRRTARVAAPSLGLEAALRKVIRSPTSARS